MEFVNNMLVSIDFKTSSICLMNQSYRTKEIIFKRLFSCPFKCLLKISLINWERNKFKDISYSLHKIILWDCCVETFVSPLKSFLFLVYENKDTKNGALTENGKFEKTGVNINYTDANGHGAAVHLEGASFWELPFYFFPGGIYKIP